MRFNVVARWAGAVLLAFLSACGGGGGGPASTKVTFAPSPVSANVQAGTVGTLTVTATVTNPPKDATYVLVEGLSPVFLDDLAITSADTTHFSVTLHSSAALEVGHHAGNLTVRLCPTVQCALTVPGTPVTLPYDVNVVPAPLAAVPLGVAEETVHWGGNPVSQLEIQVQAAGVDWTATSGASWLQIDPGTAHGTGGGGVLVRYVSAGLPLGDYTDAVTIRSTDGQEVAVPVKLHVIPAAFALVADVPSFYAINGEPIEAQAFSFGLDTGASGDWSVRSDASWLTADAQGDVLPASVLLQPDPSVGNLASGQYGANLTLSASDADDLSVVSQLTLLPSTLSTSVSSITLGGPKGRDLTSAQGLTLGLNTGTNAFPWVLSGLPNWVSSSATSGTVSHAGTPVSFTPVAAGLRAGSTSAMATFTATVNGDVVTTPVTLNMNIDQRRLLSSAWGVAFASTPTGTLLSRTLFIRDNFGGALAWTATSDSAWLTATAGGRTGGASSLVLTADPATLANGTTSIATVTVATTTPGVSPAQIRVGLYKDATGLPALTSLPLVGTYSIVADKIRPLVYTSEVAGTIRAYNAYTAAVVATIPIAGAHLSRMAVSPDGGFLYALDESSSTLHVIDLASLTETDSWNVASESSFRYSPVLAVRPNGVDVVLLGNGTAWANGRRVTGGIDAGLDLNAVEDGRVVFGATMQPGFVPRLDRWSVDHSEVSGGVLFTTSEANTIWSGGQADFAVASDGSGLYLATDSASCWSLDPTSLTPFGALPGGDYNLYSVEVTRSGRILCAAERADSGLSSDLWVYSPSGALTASYLVDPNGQGIVRMTVTADGFVAVATTYEPRIAFLPLGP